MRFPREHWPKIRSNNPWSASTRDRQTQRRCGIYPNDAALLRLAAGLLAEVNDEWLQHRYISQASMATLLGGQHGPSGPADTDQQALEGGALAGVGKSTA